MINQRVEKGKGHGRNSDSRIRIDFDDAVEMAEWCDTDMPNKPHSHTYPRRSGFCTYSWEDAQTMLKEGCQEQIGADMIEFSDKLSELMLKPVEGLTPSVAGGVAPNMGAILAGAPPEYLAIAQVDEKRETIDIVIDGCYNSTVKESNVLNRGALITVLIDELVALGNEVNIHIAFATRQTPSKDGRHDIFVNFDMSTRHGYSRDLLAMIGANTAFFRRHIFAVMEKVGKRSNCDTYGSPENINLKRDGYPPNTVLFGKLDSSGQKKYSTLEGCKEELTKILDNILKAKEEAQDE
jgi:hypothetical protein